MKKVTTIIILLFSIGLLQAQQLRIQKSSNKLYGVAEPKRSGNVRWVIKPMYNKLLPIPTNRKLIYAQLGNGSQWGVVSMDGEIILPFTHSFIEVNNLMSGNFSNYVKDFIENRIRIWQQKGEFEKTIDYKKRVNIATREAQVQQYTAEAKKRCLEIVKFMEVETSLGSYDPDNETYLVETTMGNIVVPVPISKAPMFKENFSVMTKETLFDLYGWTPRIKHMDFKLANEIVAAYHVGSDAKYALADIKYNFDPIVIEEGQINTTTENRIAETKTIEIGKSDVDTDIPFVKTTAENTFVVVIANEKYQDAVDVPNAINDGEVFAKYCNRTFGVAETNIHLVKNATFNNIKREVNWLQQIAEAYDGNVKFIVYYAGHGIPDEQTRTSYLLPVDGLGNDVSTGYSLNKLYDELNQMNTQSVVVFLDACFSGATRDGGMMMAARGVAIKVKQEPPTGNMVVLSAAQGDETAYPYTDKCHGMFTYYLLKKIQETKGNVNLGELSDFVKDNVQRRSIVINGKSQTPTVNASLSLGEKWKSWKLK